ncbi:MAG: methyltransferase domain-containing protein [bacterium]
MVFVLRELSKIVGNKKDLALLEIGCADGVVLRNIYKESVYNFSEMIGIDTSDGMIKEAGIIDSDKNIKYYVRGCEPQGKKFDIVIEVGVANYANIDEELKYAKNNLKQGGVYILSLAGSDSLHGYFWKGIGYNNFLNYSEYENKIAEFFKIEKIIPVGFYVPFIWKLPVMARLIQPIVEFIFGPILPNLFHEKIYILKIK